MVNNPNIRFAGFSDEWVQCKFSNLAKVRRGLTYKPSDVRDYGIRVLRSSNIAEDTFLFKSDDVFVSEEAVNIDKVKNGDILITSANGSSRLVGKHALIKGVDDDTVHGGFMLVARAEKPEFVNAIMSSSWYSKFINNFVSGGNGAIGNLSKSNLEVQKVYVPSEKEQQKIGSLFATLDHKIGLEERQIALLKDLKKGFLQKMFPKNGATVPELRFAGFANDWEERKLGEVIDSLYNGQTPSRANKANWNGKINWFTSGELNRGIVTDTIEKITSVGQKDALLRIVPAGTFVIAITGLEAKGTRGNCAKLAIDTTLNQSCMAIFPNEKMLDTKFLFQWYRKVGEEYGLRYTQGTKQQSYNAELIKILPITLPNIEEQQKIGSFFKKLDNTIALHQRKLDLLKDLKKGLLQNLLI